MDKRKLLAHSLFGLLLAASLLLPTRPPAEAGGGGGGSCTFCLCVKDVTCSNCDCAAPTGCESRIFTVPCSGTYHLVSKVKCDNQQHDCSACQACVEVWQPGGVSPIGGCHNTHCDYGDCDWMCSVDLRYGVTYELRVCLTYCPNMGNCASCGSSCTAYGCVYRDVITECVPL
jgi:hypothetical protein